MWLDEPSRVMRKCSYKLKRSDLKDLFFVCMQFPTFAARTSN